LPGAGVGEVGGDAGERGLSGGVEGADGAELGAVVVADWAASRTAAIAASVSSAWYVLSSCNPSRSASRCFFTC
jgi:hypothetical protein